MYSRSFDYFYIVAGLSFGESVKGHAHELVDQQKDDASRWLFLVKVIAFSSLQCFDSVGMTMSAFELQKPALVIIKNFLLGIWPNLE